MMTRRNSCYLQYKEYAQKFYLDSLNCMLRIHITKVEYVDRAVCLFI